MLRENKENDVLKLISDIKQRYLFGVLFNLLYKVLL